MPAPPAAADARYDLVHVRPRPWEQGRIRTASLVELDFEFAGSSLTLEAARAQRQAHDRHGISTLIVPARYGAAAIGIAEAALHALAAAPPRGEAVRPEVPRLHADHPMFFTFQIRAAETDTPASGSASGRLVYVDKCDGHLWTAEEMAGYFALIGPR
ncbi:MAG: hypothetical protein ABR950_11420 [Candidatus Dormibacteria bacterium]|jgi:hypothetical protein